MEVQGSRGGGEEMSPGQSSSCLSAPGCSALPSPPGSAPVVHALLDLLRGGPAAEPAQDGILGGDPTARKKGGRMNRQSTGLGVRMLGLKLDSDLSYQTLGTSVTFSLVSNVK